MPNYRQPALRISCLYFPTLTGTAPLKATPSLSDNCKHVIRRMAAQDNMLFGFIKSRTI